VLRAIRTDERTRTIPVLVMHSSEEQRDAVESYNPGVNGCVAKPVKFGPFRKALSELGADWVFHDQPLGPALRQED